MKIYKAIELLQEASAVMLPEEAGYPVLYASIDENDVYLKWTAEGHTFFITIHGEENSSVELKNNTLIFIDNEGDAITMQLLHLMELPKDNDVV